MWLFLSKKNKNNQTIDILSDLEIIKDLFPSLNINLKFLFFILSFRITRRNRHFIEISIKRRFRYFFLTLIF